jgi:hypothetical protein
MNDPHVKDVAARDPLAARKAAAQVRLEEALAAIEEAQGLIDRAGASLCSVRGMAKEWRRLGALYDKVKATWYAVNNRARRLRTAGHLLLDREPAACELPAAPREPRA